MSELRERGRERRRAASPADGKGAAGRRTSRRSAPDGPGETVPKSGAQAPPEPLAAAPPVPVAAAPGRGPSAQERPPRRVPRQVAGAVPGAEVAAGGVPLTETLVVVQPAPGPRAPKPPTAGGPAPAAGTVSIAVPAREPALLDEFRGLLGQPVGLRLDSVSRTYRLGEIEVDAVQDVNLEVAPGEFVAIVGPSGCGKTTLLGLMGGLDRPTSGHVYAAGATLDQLTEAALADYRLQRVGTIFQTFNLIPSLSAEDNVAMPLLLAGVPAGERRDRARRLLGLVGLESRLRFRPGRLSGGEQQRVAVARALCGRPGLVLADEPTGNLDTANGEHVLKLLEDLHRRGATVVLVTHDPEVAARADRVVRMRDGRTVGGRSRGRKTARAPLSLDPPTRLAAGDALMIGVDAVARRPLRTALTAAGTALGMVLTALILSLSESTDLGRGAAFLAALTLLVAAFGIVNTMYTSVLDRTREIGVFKALGARSQDVTLMFIAESGIIGGTGGVIGAAAAGLLAGLGNQAAGSRVFGIDVRIAIVVVLLAIGLSLLSGILPALRAARQDPMRALRYE